MGDLTLAIRNTKVIVLRDTVIVGEKMGLDGHFRCVMECVEDFDYSAIGLPTHFAYKIPVKST